MTNNTTTNQSTYITVANFENNVVKSFFVCNDITEAAKVATYKQGANLEEVRECLKTGNYTTVDRYQDGAFQRQSIYVK